MLAPIVYIVRPFLPRVYVQGVKQSVYMYLSIVVVIGTKITRSRVLGICACCKHNQSVDIGEKLVCIRALNCSKGLTSATNRAFSVQYTCSLSTTPTLLAYADTTAHAQAQCWKGSSNHKTALPQSVAILRYSGSRVHGVCALQSSSSLLNSLCT